MTTDGRHLADRAPARAGTPGQDLPHRLRHETADLHRRTEETVGLPGSVRSRAGYAALLRRLHELHAAVETRWAEHAWAGSWAAVGVDVDAHRRSADLATDLRLLPDGDPDGTGAAVPDLAALPAGFPALLGSLYVLEGSSLGGRMLAPAIREQVGDVPTTFFAGEGRHPAAWRSVQAALRRFDGDADGVVAGARATFVAFGRHVSPALTEAL